MGTGRDEVRNPRYNCPNKEQDEPEALRQGRLKAFADKRQVEASA